MKLNLRLAFADFRQITEFVPWNTCSENASHSSLREWHANAKERVAG